MKIPIYHIDAFTDHIFSGNPAAVCPLENWLPEQAMQSIAFENNLSETAFFVQKNGTYQIRWFTPVEEAPLCGHATLASAFVIFNEIDPHLQQIHFTCLSGDLFVSRRDDLIELNFPIYDFEKIDPPAAIVKGINFTPLEVLRSKSYVVILKNSEQVKQIQFNLDELKKIDLRSLVITAAGEDCDFVSRYFVPRSTHFEDPVTGSAHCVLAPYWARQLGKNKLYARQLSKRVGEIICTIKDQRVFLAGAAVLYSKGLITLIKD